MGSQEGVLAEPVSVNSLGRRRRTGRSVHAQEATEQRQWVGDVWAVSQGTPPRVWGSRFFQATLQGTPISDLGVWPVSTCLLSVRSTDLMTLTRSGVWLVPGATLRP